MIRNFIALILIQTLFYSSAYPCSSFQLKNPESSFVGKSYDWTFGDALIIYNPSHIEKSSLTFSATQKKIQWTSKFSSITFNQYGLEFPNGGMNEAGLTVEVLWLDASVYPMPDDKAVLNELQWIQYALDTQSTVDGVIKSLDTIRIDPVYAKVHYFVCDLNKNCATIEYVNGKAVFGTYDKLNLEVITNSTYQQSNKYLSLFNNFGGIQDVIWTGYDSLDRFVRINEQLRTYVSNGIVDPITSAFATLDSVKRELVQTGVYTQWQIVHDKNNLITHFKTTFGSQLTGTVDLKSFPTKCTDRYYFDISQSARGDVNSKFKKLPFYINYDHVKKTLRKVMPNAPEQMINAIAAAPFKFKCEE